MCGVDDGDCPSDRAAAEGGDNACLEEKSERVMALRSVSKKMSFVVAGWMVDEPYRSLACSCLVKEERGSFTSLLFATTGAVWRFIVVVILAVFLPSGILD